MTKTKGKKSKLKAVDGVDKNKVTVMIKIPKHLLERIDSHAERRGQNRTGYMLEAAASRMDREDQLQRGAE